MKRILTSALLVVCLSISITPAAQAESVQTLDSNPYSVAISWWNSLLSYFGLGVEELSYAVASSSESAEDPEVWPRSGMCIDPNGRTYPAPCVDNP